MLVISIIVTSIFIFSAFGQIFLLYRDLAVKDVEQNKNKNNKKQKNNQDTFNKTLYKPIVSEIMPQQKIYICSYCSTKYRYFHHNCKNCGSNSIDFIKK